MRSFSKGDSVCFLFVMVAFLLTPPVYAGEENHGRFSDSTMSCPRNTDTAVESGSAKLQGKEPLLYLNGRPLGKSLVLSLIIRGSQVKADIIKLDIFSEPSHTHLLSVRSIDYPELLFDVMDAFAFSAPAATVTTGMKLAGPRVSVPMPPDTDGRIRVEAIFNEGKNYYSKTLADIKLGSISEPFAFSVSEDVSPRAGGNRFCGECNDHSCGCIFCPTPFNTPCCPQCILLCGWQQCPQP